MNESWAWRPLGELFEIGSGKAMSAAARDGPDKTRFLRTSNVLWDEIDLAAVDEMSIPERELPAKLLKRGDLLVCEGGEIGRAAIWGGDMGPMSFQNHLHRLRPLVPDVEPRFYVFFLQCAFTQLGIFEGAGNKTTIPNLSRSRLAELNVPQPSLAEQRAISAALGRAREALKAQDRSLAAAQGLEHAAMHTLFTRGLRGEAQKETEIGPVPKSWEVVDFSALRDRLQYGTSTRCTPEPSTYPVLRIPNVAPQRVSTSDLKYCDLPDSDAARFLLDVGDLLFIRTNGVLDRLGACAVYSGQPPNALFASYLIRASLKADRVMPQFASYFLSSDRGTSMIAERAVPASDGKFNLNTAAIDSFLVPLPPLDQQGEIVATLDAIDRKVDLHHRKRGVLEELFKALLHKLMTREIRVHDLVAPDVASDGAGRDAFESMKESV